MKFGIEHPWAHWLIFRKNQFWGPSEYHVLVIQGIFWPFLGKGATKYTQQCDIWHGAALGTSIKIQEESIWRTMWGPCFDNKVVISWPHLGLLNHWVVKGKTGHSCRPLVLFEPWDICQQFCIEPHLFNFNTHVLTDSGTPLQSYCGMQGTAVDLWSCCKTIGRSGCFHHRCPLI